MVKYLSEKITDYFYYKNIIREEDKEILIYGLQLITSTIFGIMLILVLGLLFDKLVHSVGFLICFIQVRRYSGGYHANSYLKCNLTLMTLYLVTILLTIYTPISYVLGISIIMTIIAAYIILKYAPVDNVNKRLTELQRKKNKRITLYILLFIYLVEIVMYKINIQLFYTIIITIFLISILIKGGVGDE